MVYSKTKDNQAIHVWQTDFLLHVCNLRYLKPIKIPNLPCPFTNLLKRNFDANLCKSFARNTISLGTMSETRMLETHSLGC